MSRKSRALARTLIREEVKISDEIQTVRLRLISRMWIRIQNWNYAWSLGFGLYCVDGLELGVGFAL